ncbi:MAG: hypothetical protein IKD43_01175 [Clostridia bacterium]|nr:hypothetical protein [Clostridia bacterium]
MRETMSAEEVIVYLKDLLEDALEETQEALDTGALSEFAKGSRNAYIIILEELKRWEKAEENGLFYDTEEAFPAS